MSNPVVVSFGDSMTQGASAAANNLYAPYPYLLAMPGLWNTFDKGVNGNTVANMLTTYTTQVSPLFDATAPANVCIVFAGTNDFAINGATVATTYANLVTLCQAIRAVGFKVVVVQMPSRTGNNAIGGESLDTDKTAYNALIDANWTTFADAEFVLPSTITANGSFSNTTYFQTDGVHPNQFTHNTIFGPGLTTIITPYGPAGTTNTNLPLATDSFVRADENPLNASTWGIPTGASALKLVSNTVQASAGGVFATEYTKQGPASWPVDNYSQAVAVSSANSQFPSVATRIQTGIRTWYIAQLTCGAGATIPTGTGTTLGNTTPINIVKNINTVQTTLATGQGTAWQPGDILEIETVGTTINAYQLCAGGVTKILRATATDAVIASGLPGISIVNLVASFGAWTGGAVNATSAISAGSPQAAKLNTTFATNLAVIVRDSKGNAIQGITVTFTAPGSGPSGTFAGGVNTAVTNASGIATAPAFTSNGFGGSYAVVASVPGLANLSFNLVNGGGDLAFDFRFRF